MPLLFTTTFLDDSLTKTTTYTAFKPHDGYYRHYYRHHHSGVGTVDVKTGTLAYNKKTKKKKKKWFRKEKGKRCLRCSEKRPLMGTSMRPYTQSVFFSFLEAEEAEAKETMKKNLAPIIATATTKTKPNHYSFVTRRRCGYVWKYA